MADDKKAFSLMFAVSSNIDRLRQSIDALRELHDRWKDTSGTFINLIAQLSALKSSLGEMQDWMNFAIQDMHPQLLGDLDVLMASCEELVHNLKGLVIQLQPDHDRMDLALKMKLALAHRSMRRLQSASKRQTDAVNLLLAACKCHQAAQRKILVHKSRQIRKENNSALTTLARTSKLDGPCIRALTQLSRLLQWFRYLFYIKLFRRGGPPPPTEQDYVDEAAMVRSQAIDRRLEEDATWLRRETKIVLMGAVNSGKELIMRQMKVLYADGYPREKRLDFRYAVRSTVRLLMHAIIDLIKDTGISLSGPLEEDFAILLHEVETVDIAHITPAAVNSLQNIWDSDNFSTLYVRNFEIDFPQYSPYFANEIQRIASDDYVPTEADIIRLNHSMGGIKELRFAWDELDVHLFNISGYIPEQFRKRWFHQLDNATALVYTVDISTYDRPYLGQPTSSQLQADFLEFDAWANSPAFAGSSIILVLNNFNRFREKLAHSPLSTFFRDFESTGEVDRETEARQYVLQRFKQLNRNKLSIYSYWVDLDMSDNQNLYAALKKSLQHIQQRKARSEVWSTDEFRETVSRVGSPVMSRGGDLSTVGSVTVGSFH